MKITRSILTLLLAGLVLVSSVGVTINQHVCMGQVRSTALFAKAKSCGMPEAEMALAMKMKGCCDEKSMLVKTKTVNALTASRLSTELSFHLIATILPILYSIFSSNAVAVIPQYAFYKPPLLKQDITLASHSFLI